MAPRNRLVWLASLYSLALTVSVTGKETFRLEETAVERTEPWSALHAIRRDYARHGLEIPLHLEEAVNRLAPPDRTTVAATPLPGDREYNVRVQIGNKNFTLEFDTGSSDL